MKKKIIKMGVDREFSQCFSDLNNICGEKMRALSKHVKEVGYCSAQEGYLELIYYYPERRYNFGESTFNNAIKRHKDNHSSPEKFWEAIKEDLCTRSN